MAVGLFGYLGYDMVRAIERLGPPPPDPLGLPDAILDRFANEQRVRLPMRPGNRSLNLSNTVAIVVFEAWRQAGFEGGA